MPTSARKRRRSWLSEIDRSSVRRLIPIVLPRHQPSHGLGHQSVRSWRARLPSHEVELQQLQRRVRPGSLRQPGRQVRRLAPRILEGHDLVDQFVGGHAEQRGCCSRPEPRAHDRQIGRQDLDLGAGERADQLRSAADRALELDAAGGQVALYDRPWTGVLDPDRADSRRQGRQR